MDYEGPIAQFLGCQGISVMVPKNGKTG